MYKMSETVFNLFKDPLYKATVKRGGKEVVSYNVTVVQPIPQIEKLGIKSITLIYDPIGQIIGNPYIDVKKILFETIFQINQEQIIDEITFLGDNNEQFRENNNVLSTNVSNPNGSTNILFSLNKDGTIERSILGRSARDTYIITYTTQTKPPSKPKYELWFNVVAWFSLVFSFLIAILSLIKRFSDGDRYNGKTWIIFILSLIIFIISISAISVIYTS